MTAEIWKRETDLLYDLNTNFYDRLSIVEGMMSLDKGREVRVRPVPIVEDPQALATHLDYLIQQVASVEFASIQKEKVESDAYYERVADFKRRVKCLCERLSELQYIFRDHDLQLPGMARLYSSLFFQVNSLLEQTKNFKSTLQKPPLERRLPRVFTYNERTSYKSCFSHFSRVPLQDVVKGAKEALRLAKVEEQSQGLLNYFITPTPSLHRNNFLLIAADLLRFRYITEEVAASFAALAPHVDKLELKDARLASDDITQFQSYIDEDTREGALSVIEFLKKMKAECEKKGTTLKTLEETRYRYKNINDFITDTRLKLMPLDNLFDVYVKASGDMDIPASRASPYITPKALDIILNAVASSTTCQDIQLEAHLTALPWVQERLQQGNFKNIESKKPSVMVYKKSQPILPWF